MTEPTVLIVDDEPRVLDSLEALLAMDHRVLRTDRGEEALALLASEPVAVIVSDQRMPSMLGTELLARSRDVAPDTVRILLTAFTDADALMESINAASIYHFLLKPWDAKELVHVVRRGVERYQLHRERQRLLEDLAGRNRDLEAALGRLQAAQADLVREASLRSQLQRYVSPRLVDLAVAHPELLELPGDWREATVLFADIRGFTRLIERTPAPVVIRMLDDYLNAMLDVIFRHQGTVEQLIGDEIVALFGMHAAEDGDGGGRGAPARAVEAALDMTATVARLSRGWRQNGRPGFDIGCGISSGPVWAATIGSGQRRELIVVGRPMIAAARIQRMTRLFGAHIIAGEETFGQVRDHVRYRELGTPRLKGLKDRAPLFEILGVREPAAAEGGRDDRS
jgi:class 3 adenylate cyclase/CheY-like chemotaxis protein